MSLIDQNWMKKALRLAVRGRGNVSPNPPVGCILVKDNRIISCGYNGFLPGCPHISKVRNNHEQATVHAEQNAICDCAKRGVSCEGATAYITHYPCIICTRLLLASGIKDIKYLEDYKNDELVKTFTDELNVKVKRLI